MLKHLGVIIGVLAVAPLAANAAPGPGFPRVRACSLLTPSEISSAIGAQPGPSREDNVVIPDGPSKGESMATCMWPTGQMDMVTVSAVKALQGAQRDAALKDLDNSVADMKQQGWTEEKQDINGARCSIMTPPRQETDAPNMTGCFVEAKGVALSVGTMARAKKVAIQPIKDLLDKAISRLP